MRFVNNTTVDGFAVGDFVRLGKDEVILLFRKRFPAYFRADTDNSVGRVLNSSIAKIESFTTIKHHRLAVPAAIITIDDHLYAVTRLDCIVKISNIELLSRI